MGTLAPKLRPGAEGEAQGKVVRAKMAGIKQGVLKVNLVAALVRGMSVEDAMAQLAVNTKRAAKTVSKAVHAARSNAVNNHGLDGSKLLVAEAFVGKDLFLKRVFPHGRGKSGVRVRQKSQLTVKVREMTDAEVARRAAAHAARGRSSWKQKLRRLAPHTLLQVGSPRAEPAAAAAAPEVAA